MHSSVALATIFVAAILATPAPAQQASPAPSGVHPGPVTVSRAVRASGTIRIDGKLDEAAWASAPITDTFTQVDPAEGEPASQRTEVRVLYDDQALYVGARLYDTGKVNARLLRRDGPLGDSDWFGLMIDSYHDHRTAFGFDVNPLGVRRDEVKTIDQDDNSWDAVWEVATSIDAGGWTVEYRVPFSQLRFATSAEQTWGVQFERIIGRNNEYAVSTFTPKKEQGGVPRYGHLVGLRDIHPGKRLEVLPYTVQKASYVDPGLNPFRTNHEWDTSFGADFRYRVASNLTLTGSVNPDFGQVEVDPAVVNLGVYETFFEEKRPFFVEGSEIFDFGVNGTSGGRLFYSRRIGHPPSLGAPTPAADVPDLTRILGAGKLTGKLAGWSVGVLEAVTNREEARYAQQCPTAAVVGAQPAIGASPDCGGTAIVEPLTNYTVARARRELRGGQTILGAIATSVNRDLSTDALRSALRSSAFAGGIDFVHQWANRSWIVYGDAELSRVAGSAQAITLTQRQSNHFFQRPDADHLGVDANATSLTGYSMNAALGKQAGLHWRGEIAAAATSPEYEVNDIGFSYRTDRRDAQARVTYVENTPGAVLRRWSSSLAMRSEHNYAWQPILTVATLSGNATTLGYLGASYVVQRYFQAYDDRLTRGGPIAVRPAWWGFHASLASDARKPVTLELSGNREDHDFDSRNWDASLAIGLKTSPRWNLTLTPSFLRAHVSAQYVGALADSSYTATFGTRYVFAPLEQTQIGLETRFNFTFTPALSLETYVQPLLSSGDFGNARQLVAPRTYDFTPIASVDANQADFNLRSLRGNAVLRWEWRQGSTLFLAWQQRREDDVRGLGDFSFSRDRRALFSTRPDNIFVLKVNYWINP